MELAEFESAVKDLRVEDKVLTPMQRSAVKLFFRTRKVVVGLPVAVPATVVSPPTGVDTSSQLATALKAVASKAERRVKAASVLDPKDESDVPGEASL